MAFTFPGQGSQRPGMGISWVDHPSWGLVEEASRAIDRDIEALLLHADSEELTETRNSQLTTFVLSMVVLDAVERLGIGPAFTAGHSLGEYSALVAGGALDFEEGCKIVSARSEAMQQASEDQPGTMYAVLGLDDEQVDVACRRADGDAWVANYNAPGQVIISGSKESLEKAGSLAKDLGAKRIVQLPVGGAFHTPYMASARTHLRKALESAKFRNPEVPVVANVDALVHIQSQDWQDLCSAQLCSPIRWRQSIEQLVSLGTTTFIELGPGNVLTGLARRIAPDTTAINVAAPEDLDKLVDTLASRQVAEKADAVDQHHGDSRHGEHLFMHERLVVSNVSGLFSTVEDNEGGRLGETVSVGTLIGRAGETEIRTPFAGRLMGMLAIAGERISTGQPIAWLRVEDPAAS